MRPRVLKEIKTIITNGIFELETSNRGAIARKILGKGKALTISAPEGETQPGSKGGFFCAPVIFGRLVNRVLNFQRENFKMPYPLDMNADEVDPNKIYIHGIHHWYTWDIVTESKEHIKYQLGPKILPENYPFPHTATISYFFEDKDLIVEVSVSNPCRVMPAMLTMHPFWIFKRAKNDPAPKLKAELLQKFEYDATTDLPMNWTEPFELGADAPFKKFTELTKDLDHSFLAKPVSCIAWPDKTILMIKDETNPHTCPFSPLQIWTTGADQRNAFGIENGGPANLPWLTENKKVPSRLLPVVQPGETKTRRVRYRID